MMIYAVMAAAFLMAGFAQASLVVHYKFDEAAGSGTATDSSGNGFDATMSSGSGWLADGGHFGGALDVAGFRKAYLPVGCISNLTEVTVSAWIKGGTDNSSFFFACDATTESGASKTLDIYASATGFEAAAGFNGNNYSSRSVSGTTGTDTSIWEHWAMTFEKATPTAVGTLTVFKNGVSVGVNNNVYADRDITGIQFAEVGRANDGTFKGQLDDFRIYNTALTATEIQNTVMIPEPATLGLVAAFGGGILFIRRRRLMS